MKSTSDLLAETRAIRLRLARARRRIDRRLRGLEREGRRLFSWQTLLQQLPTQSFVGALGVGLASLTGLPKRKLRALGVHLAKLARDRAVNVVLRDVRDLWTRQAPDKPATAPPPSGGDDHA